MGEILFSCAGNRRAVIATLSVIGDDVARFEGSKDVLIAKSIESATDLHKGLRVKTYKTKESAFQGLEAVIYVFRSRMEALLFLISALLSRGLAGCPKCLCWKYGSGLWHVLKGDIENS
ncbi:uncharacterized protein LOC126782248 isoform X3 [Argentina anserina]|uniref:uncharacterized protein LOC126782248 isoform X3 n=1 Tax=Argentina anserina TaxID=57926 RepID=UPI0021762755|nr:uncharacterized protein LOC126782248 isoform X3 [Potentilla anserina]